MAFVAYFVVRQVASRMVNEDYDPSESDEQLLAVFKDHGRVNPYLLREETGLTKQAVNERLKQLTAAGWIRKVTRGLYEYVDDPRESTENTGSE